MVDPKKVQIITSELTEPGFDEKDYVSNKKEREYIVKIPRNYQFKKEDFIITDLEALIGDKNPLAVSFLDHDDKKATYTLDGHEIIARFYWNNAGTKGSIVFNVDGRYSESRQYCKKEFGFDPMPTPENISKISNFKMLYNKSSYRNEWEEI